MNIPDEVMATARSDFYHHYPLLPDLALERHAQVIAEWARKEALDQAADVAQDHIYDRRRSDYGDAHTENLGISTADAIRALAEE